MFKNCHFEAMLIVNSGHFVFSLYQRELNVKNTHWLLKNKESVLNMTFIIKTSFKNDNKNYAAVGV